MKNPTKLISVPIPSNRKSGSSLLGSITALAAALALLGGSTTATAQSNDFDDGEIASEGWSTYSYPAPATYAFPTVGTGKGLELGIVSGGLLGFAYPPNIYTDFYVSADLVNWDPTKGVEPILLGRGSIVFGIGDGYVIVYDPNDDGTGAGDRRGGSLQMYAIFSSGYIGVAACYVTLEPGRSYRFVFQGTGVDTAAALVLSASIYDSEDLTTPIVTIQASGIGSYDSGVSGVAIYDDDTTTGTVTWDNYYAAATDPNTSIAPAIQPFISGTPSVVTRTPTNRFTNFHPAASGISFTARTFTADNIVASATKLYLNGVDVSASLAPLPANGPTASFTTAAGTLVANTVYDARIEVEASNGKKSTNTFWLDTFTDAFMAAPPVKTIECEDFNYSNGVYQLDPIPVSGENTNGAVVNGSGVGYFASLGFEMKGTEGVDYHDNRTAPDTGINNPYRSFDNVSTYQGETDIQDATHPTPSFPWDPPIVPGNTRQAYQTVGMKEYELYDTDAGEWVNYTRSFANQNYNVYLRVGCHHSTEVTLDTVTSNPGLPGQTTTPLGRFYIPNNLRPSFYRYVPLYAAGVPAVVNLNGTSTVRMTMQGTPSKDRRIILPNYLAFVPTASAVTSPVVLESSSAVNGPYTDAVGAAVNLGTKTITVPVGGAANFYRIRSDVAYTITSITIVGGNVVIVYN